MTDLRAFVEVDAMQPQWAAYVAQTCQGDPPWAGMAQLYVEVAPANEVFSLVNAAGSSSPSGYCWYRPGRTRSTYPGLRLRWG